MSNIEKYSVIKTQLGEAWDRFVISSPNGTAFILSDYLNALSLSVQPYFCYKRQELMGAVLCILSDNGESVVGHDYVIYDGLIYRDLSYLNRAQQFSEEFKIQQCIAEFLIEEYSSIRLSLHPSIQDIRPFLWCNYDKKGPKYLPCIRYTSYISIKDFKKSEKLEEISIYNNASVARRQEIRYSRKKQVLTEQTEDIGQFIFFYKKTMSRQGIKVENRALNKMKKLLDILTRSKKCIMMKSSDINKNVGSMAVFLLDQHRAYYLFGANDPSMRSQHTGTAVLWESFYLLSVLGYDEVDLEGINSPYRGWFKLSFGGSCNAYFEVVV